MILFRYHKVHLLSLAWKQPREHLCYYLCQTGWAQESLRGNALQVDLTAIRYSFAATEADALLRTSHQYHKHPWEVINDWVCLACFSARKRSVYTADGQKLNCNKCLLLKKHLWPKIIHTFKKKKKCSETLTELRSWSKQTSRLQRTALSFTKNGLCGILGLKVRT